MGSFSMICSVSGLGISWGTPVRCLLLTASPYTGDDPRKAWLIRTPPIRAKYNDYGSIDNIHKDDKHIVELWLRGLREDTVEKGQGDNSYHERAVSRVMSLEELLDGVRGRLEVIQDSKHFWARPPRPDAVSGYWTSTEMAEVEAAIEAAFPGCVTRNAENGKYVIDEPVPGMLRVRFGHYESGAVHLRALEQVCGVLNTANRTAVLVAGSGRYAAAADVLVFPKPRADGSAEQLRGPMWDMRQGADADLAKTLRVGLAMIREDVWQVMIHYPHSEYLLEGREGPSYPHVMQGAYAWYGLDAIRENVRKTWTSLRKTLLEEPLAEGEMDVRDESTKRFDEFLKKHREDEEVRRAALTDEERAAEDEKNKERIAAWEAEETRKREHPYFGDFRITSMHHDHMRLPGAWAFFDSTPGVIGVGEHFSMLLADKQDASDGLLESVAELCALRMAMSGMGIVLRPSESTGPQCPEWDQNERFLETLLDITKKEMKERDYERRAPRNMGALLASEPPDLKNPVDKKAKKKKPVAKKKPASKPSAKAKAKRAPARRARGR